MADDYEVVWNGTMDRDETCPSLVSHFHGASSLTYTAPDRWEDGEITRTEYAVDTQGRTVGLTRTQAQRARRLRESRTKRANREKLERAARRIA